jgi:hypothetical protein
MSLPLKTLSMAFNEHALIHSSFLRRLEVFFFFIFIIIICQKIEEIPTCMEANAHSKHIANTTMQGSSPASIL